jgi:uncharacterized membrane protein
LLLAIAMFLQALVRREIGPWVVFTLVAIGCWYLAGHGTDVVPLFVPTILVPTFLAWLFGHTLFKGRTPLISRVAKLTHPSPEEIEPAVWPYTRALTQAWTTLFVAIAAANFSLAAFSAPRGLLIAIGVTPPFTVPMELWSWFANLLSYAIVATFFVVEYLYRKRRFPNQPYRNFFDFLQRCVAVGPKLISEP